MPGREPAFLSTPRRSPASTFLVCALPIGEQKQTCDAVPAYAL